LQRGGDQPAPKSNAGTDIPLEAIQQLKSDPSDENKKFFDDMFGPGSSESILGGGEIGEGGTSESDVSGGEDAGVSLIRSAQAGEVEQEKESPAPEVSRKNDFSGQKTRKESKKSMKSYSKIAVSEFKNEWKNMDDSEKIEWFEENGSALKYGSPRGHRKANKEVTAIRRKARFSKKGKEEYQLMREERKKQ